MYSKLTFFFFKDGSFFLSFLFLKRLFIYLWLRQDFIAAHGLSLVAVSRGYSSLWCAGFSLQRLVAECWFQVCGLAVVEYRLQVCGLELLQHSGSAVVVHGFSCFVACGIFPDQGLNLCPLHWHHCTNGLVDHWSTVPPGKFCSQ